MNNLTVDEVVLWEIELPQSNVDGSAKLTLSLQFVKNPSTFERTFSELGKSP